MVYMSLKKTFITWVYQQERYFPSSTVLAWLTPYILFHPIPHFPGRKRNVWMKAEQKCLISLSELVSGKPAEDYDRKLSYFYFFVAVAIVNNGGNLICCGRTVHS